MNVSNKLEINLVLLTINNSVFESEKNTIVQIREVISDIVFASHGKWYNMYQIVYKLPEYSRAYTYNFGECFK